MKFIHSLLSDSMLDVLQNTSIANFEFTYLLEILL